MLASIGLALDILGAIVLLGPSYGFIERQFKRIDPIYRLVTHGIETLYREGTKVEDGDKKFEGQMSAGRLGFTITRWFLNRRIDGHIDRDDSLSLAGVAIIKNDEKIRLAEKHDGSIRAGTLETRVVGDWIEETEERRMYRTGGALLLFGFSLQLISLNSGLIIELLPCA
jgi:hypothetical protein